MKYLVILLSLFALTFFTTSCASSEPETPVAENTMCAMNPGEAADQEVTTTFEGHTVAFCCGNCRAKFEGLNRGQKVAKLQAVGIAVE